MTTKYVEQLLERVSAENDLDVLLRMIPKMGINAAALQSMLRTHISSLNETAAKTALFNVNPIDTILPMDVLQIVSAFTHSVDLRLVNKSFKNCCDRNQEIVERMRRQIVEESKHLFSPQINHDESTNQIFIVHAKGQPLSAKAKQYGDSVSLTTDLGQCLENCQSGDKILIESGSYVCSTVDYREINISNKHLQIIGLGDNAKIEFQGKPYGRQTTMLDIENKSHILLKNLQIEFSSENGINMRDDTSRIWVQNCNIIAKDVCIVSWNNLNSGFISILSSKLEGNSGIDAYNTEVVLIGCTFDIDVNKKRTVSMSLVSGKLNGIGNLFNRHVKVNTRKSNVSFKGNVLNNCGLLKTIRQFGSINKGRLFNNS